MKQSIAIIGAGISGLILARELNDKASVTVFEKGRGVGGRMSTHYADPFYFDHGAQCFTARTPEFQQFLEPYIKEGTVTKWEGAVINLEINQPRTKRLWKETHLVCSPNMNSLCKRLVDNINLIKNLEIYPIEEKIEDKWLLKDKYGNQVGMYDWVISTAPPRQTINLFEKYLPDNTPIKMVSMHGCYSLMIGFNFAWNQDWIAAKVINNPIKWISINSTKPHRSKTVTCIVAHSSNSWSNKHIDDDLAISQAFLLQEFQKVTEISCIKADYINIHRWRYAIIKKTQKSNFYLDHKLKLAATGDWCNTSRIEEVWASSKMLAAKIRDMVN